MNDARKVILVIYPRRNLKKKNTECKSFKCANPHLTTCCMRRILFNQSDFAAVRSCLEDTCAAPLHCPFPPKVPL
jgi:hypothetical protein